METVDFFERCNEMMFNLKDSKIGTVESNKIDREPGKEILQVKSISKTVDGVKLLDNITFTVKQDNKIAFLADNENAKTVLFQIIAGEIKPDEGELIWGTTITQNYFPKDNNYLFETNENITDWLRKYSKDPDETYVRSFLGRMLFSGDEALKEVKVLSDYNKGNNYNC